MKKPVFRFFLVIFSLFPALPTFAFYDVPPDHNFYSSIEFLSDLGAATGYEDDSFRPDSNVNRAEFLKMIFESFHIDLSENTSTDFEDVQKDNWFARYVKTALENSYITPNSLFRPADPITRAEALVMIGRLKKWNILPYLPSPNPFDDVETSSWHGVYVSYAKKNGILDKVGGSLFYPDNNLTRGLSS